MSDTSIVNTCKMFTMGVDFLTASLPRIPSHVVLSLYFFLAVSSTMGSAFLDHVVGWKQADPFCVFGKNASLSCYTCSGSSFTTQVLTAQSVTVRTLLFYSSPEYDGGSQRSYEMEA